MKKAAELQIEDNLKKAQQNYQVLMKKRQQVQVTVGLLNEGAGDAAKTLQRLIHGDCNDYYNAMMKALSMIKALKIQINQFQQGQQTGSPTKASANLKALAL